MNMSARVSCVLISMLMLGLLHCVDSTSFPRVRIFSPATNVIWMTGETRSITWEIAYIPPPPLPPTLNATLLRHNHSDFSLPIAQFVPTLNLAYNWKIPNTVPAGSDYYISLAPKRFYPGHPNIRVSRSYTFTIVPSLPPPSPANSLQLLSPQGGAVWFGGQTRYIQWKFNQVSSAANISIYIQDVATQYVGFPYPYAIVEQLPASMSATGIISYKWIVPYSFRSSKGYKITLVATYADSMICPLTVVMQTPFEVVQVGAASVAQPTVVQNAMLPTPTFVPSNF